MFKIQDRKIQRVLVLQIFPNLAVDEKIEIKLPHFMNNKVSLSINYDQF